MPSRNRRISPPLQLPGAYSNEKTVGISYMNMHFKRFPVTSVGVVLGFAMILGMGSLGASASESAASNGDRATATGSMRPIELGPSQEARCRRMTPDDRIHSRECASAKHIVALMNAERRDKVWADEMESGLRAWIESLKADGFTLRNVKCRSTWCIVEVGSAQRHILFMHLHVARNRKLFDRLDIFAQDLDDPSVQDQVIFYKRYCVPESELFDSNNHLVPNFDTLSCGRDSAKKASDEKPHQEQ